MAVTLTIAQLSAAVRLGDTAEETAQATRLLNLATQAIAKHAPDAPDVVQNEAVIRVAGYLYDAPQASAGAGFADILRNSGAAALLLPYRIHRAGSTAEAVAAARAVGTADNPVVDVSVAGITLTVTFADGSQETHTLPAGTGEAAVDDVARTAAAEARADADTAQTTANAAGFAATAAGAAAAMAQGEVDSLETVVGNIGTTAIWARDGDTTAVPFAKIAESFNGIPQDDAREINLLDQLGLARAVTSVGFAAGVLAFIHRTGDAKLVDIGQKVIVQTEAQDVDVEGPAALAGDLIFALVGTVLTISRRNVGANAPYWEVLGSIGGEPATPTPVGAVARYLIEFAAASYTYNSVPNGGFDPGGSSKLTADYPAGLSRDSLRGVLRTGVVQTDPSDQVFGSRRVVAEYLEDRLSSDAADSDGRLIQVSFAAAKIELSLNGTELVTAAERDNWRLYLTVR